MSRRRKPEKPRTDEDFDVEDADEITRCVCGLDELSSIDPNTQHLLNHEYRIRIDLGLFIQCDKCLVWQHGYCVGLFINDDVPDKYWCELCKPDLHLPVVIGGVSMKRTLYFPSNHSRTRLIEEETDRLLEKTRLLRRKTPSDSADSPTPTPLSGQNGPNSLGPTSSVSDPRELREVERRSRKDRRHGDADFDEQLQQALKESARASRKKRLSPDSDNHDHNISNAENDNDADADADIDNANATALHSDHAPHNENIHSADDSDENAPGESNDDTRPAAAATSAKKRPKLAKSTKSKKSKSSKSQPSSRNRSSTPKHDTKPVSMSREDLLNQPSKPRYVNDKSTIYELRKRTGAILEWLGRSQMELEEEKDLKLSQMRDVSTTNVSVVSSFDHDLKLMENLTEKILAWEQRFGKYAP